MEQQSKAPQDIRNVVNFLQNSKAGMHIRVGILNGKRIDYFKRCVCASIFCPCAPAPPPFRLAAPRR